MRFAISNLKKIGFVFLVFSPWVVSSALKSYDSADDIKIVQTDVVLDSIGNTVSLVYKNGYPAYYFSNIFTPVCNTGQCLPVYVNIYWRLDGTYQKYDQPVGEILTKLDHVPFTPEDYLLLDEILRGPDPRFGVIDISHGSSPQPKHSQGDQASPAPAVQSKKMISRYDMVDGVTGATAIVHQAKFVPGALYTTYTVWGLAHDSQNLLLNYSKNQLLATEENLVYHIMNPESGLQYYAFEKMLSKATSPTNRAEILMGMMDTAGVNLSHIILNYVGYNEYQLDTVAHTLERKFFATSDLSFKRRILYSWSYQFCPPHVLPAVTAIISKNPELIPEYISFLNTKGTWPDGLLNSLLNETSKMDGYYRQIVFDFLEYNKDRFSKEEWKLIKKTIKTNKV